MFRDLDRGPCLVIAVSGGNRSGQLFGFKVDNVRVARLPHGASIPEVKRDPARTSEGHKTPSDARWRLRL